MELHSDFALGFRNAVWGLLQEARDNGGAGWDGCRGVQGVTVRLAFQRC